MGDDWPLDAVEILAGSPRVLAAVADDGLRILRAGTAFARITGAGPHELAGMPLWQALGIDAERLARPLAQLDARGEGFLTTEAGHGERRFVGLTLTRCEDGQILIHGTDLSKELQLTEELRRNTSRDELTGLLRKNAVVDELGRAQTHGLARGLILVDLDNFKVINDSAGHLAGDDLLRQASERLVATVDARDSVARIGGDEFAVYVPRPAGAAALHARGEAIVASLARVYEIGGRRVSIGCSAGGTLDFGSKTPMELFGEADAALYRAKRLGRGRFVLFDDEIATRREQQRSLEEGIRDAVALGQIEAAVQGVYRLADRSVHSYEVLARWRRPGHGVMPAADFIDTASELGLTQEITEAALGDALSWLAADLRAPGGPSLAVNIDPPSLAEEGLRGRLCEILADAGVAPERVTLEVTERDPIPMHGPEPAVLRELAESGFGVAVDDFGSGASSLGYFADLPFTQIKIDRSLTDRVAGDEQVGAVMASLIGLCQRLGLELVAEGIETEAQLDALRALGCPLGPGLPAGPSAPRR